MMLLLFIVSITAAVVANVTLYDVGGPSPTISGAIFTIGVDSGGSTTYVAVFHESLTMQLGTGTEILRPTAITHTFVEGASGLHDTQSDGFGVFIETCTFVAGGAGSCVDVNTEFDAGTTMMGTFTGSPVPWTTIEDPRPQWATGAPNGAALHSPTTLAAICLLAVYLLL